MSGSRTLLVGIDLLKTIAKLPAPATLSEIARIADMFPSRVHRYLTSLVESALVQFDSQTGTYSLGPAAIDLGMAALSRVDAVRIATDAIKDLTASLHLVSHICVWGSNGPTVIRWEQGHLESAIRIREGINVNLLTTSSGQIFLTYLNELRTRTFLRRDLNQWNAVAPVAKRFTPAKIRALTSAVRTDGVARVVGMSNPLVAAISAPVFDRDSLALSLTISGFQGSFDLSLQNAPAQQLRAAAASVSHRIGGRAAMTAEALAAGFLIDPYSDWLRDEGIPIVEDYGIDLLTVETRPWPRFDASGAVVHLKGRGEFNTMFLLDIAPGSSTAPLRHMYEEIVFVIDGHGSASIENEDGEIHHFEWGPKSLFCIPLNMKHRLFNGSGSARARLALCNYFPLVKNLFHSDEFIFNCGFAFRDREGPGKHFRGEGDFLAAGTKWPHWVTNFVPDLAAFSDLQAWEGRGAGSSTISFQLGDGVMKAHLSAMPVGTYKKAHRHGPDFFIFNISGSGYSLFWYEGQQDFVRVDWRYGMLYAPPDMMFHQHFNTGPEPARYLAVALGSVKYRFLALRKKQLMGVDVQVGDGGGQIEYAQQDPRIHASF